MVDNVAAAGTPDEVSEKLEAFYDAGARHFVFSPATAGGDPASGRSTGSSATSSRRCASTRPPHTDARPARWLRASDSIRQFCRLGALDHPCGVVRQHDFALHELLDHSPVLREPDRVLRIERLHLLRREGCAAPADVRDVVGEVLPDVGAQRGLEVGPADPTERVAVLSRARTRVSPSAEPRLVRRRRTTSDPTVQHVQRRPVRRRERHGRSRRTPSRPPSPSRRRWPTRCGPIRSLPTSARGPCRPGGSGSTRRSPTPSSTR